MERREHISVNDDIQFKYNYEVMNACFDGHYSTYFDDATVATHDGCRAWLFFKYACFHFAHIDNLPNFSVGNGTLCLNRII